ncbi:MAG: bifunctional enoyl-CoA hydratase/phosphate acetyltransferase [Chloroflexota bacterium]|nr:bifunctional enoyl-CoA hydratase/phosphate acetyltransferase [Anaerolineae bacterium]
MNPQWKAIVSEEASLSLITNFAGMLDAASKKGPVPVAVAAANVAEVIIAASRAHEMGIITSSFLVGNGKRIEDIASEYQLDLSGFTVVDSPDDSGAARRAMELVARGEAKVVVKGQMETSKFLKAALSRNADLRTGRTISHVGIFEIPDFDRLLLITDGGVVLYPTLEQKIEIIYSAIEVAERLGTVPPRVALLAAADSVILEVPVTMEIAQIVAMKSRWEEAGAYVDGPLTLDSAISPSVAAQRGLSGPVAGRADVLVVPDVESGNIMAKGITYFAGGAMAGVVLGTRVPLIVGSRSDPVETRLACIGAGVLIASTSQRRSSAKFLLKGNRQILGSSVDLTE